MFRKWYTVKGFSRLIKTEADTRLGYIVNGYLYLGKSVTFERMNKTPMTYEEIIKMENVAKENELPYMLVFVGEEHTKKMYEYMEELSKYESK